MALRRARKHTTPRRGILAAMAELLERKEPLAALTGLLAEAAAGSGRLALLGGEAGVGKTALARHFASSLPPRTRMLWGACDPLSLPRPLGPLVDMAAELDA